MRSATGEIERGREGAHKWHCNVTGPRVVGSPDTSAKAIDIQAHVPTRHSATCRPSCDRKASEPSPCPTPRQEHHVFIYIFTWLCATVRSNYTAQGSGSPWLQHVCTIGHSGNLIFYCWGQHKHAQAHPFLAISTSIYMSARSLAQ